MNIYIAILSLSTLSFAVAYMSALYKINQMSNAFFNSLMTQDELRLAYEQYLESIKTKNESDIYKENYIKFLSDSRETAFNYIDEVQSALIKFFNEVNPQIEYYNKYGIVVDGMIQPHDFALKKISKEVEDLKMLLPLDYNKDKDEA